MIGIVADDITGANDIGIMYAKAGLQADVFTYEYLAEKVDLKLIPDVLITDTHSRLDQEEIAYHKVFTATKKLEELGCTRFFNKTCSVFRGNIGAEFDAMLDALDESFAIVVLGYPKNGRTTIHQEHFVYGKKLEESQFRHDPVHPMEQSNLVDILQSQTQRKVAHVDIETVRKGSEVIKEVINEKRDECNYLLFDVEDQNSLKEIARAVHQEKVIAGSSGIAEELALLMETDNGRNARTISPDERNAGVLCVAGSLTPQTRKQIDYMKRNDLSTFELDSLEIFTPNKDDYLQKMKDELVKHISDGEDVLLHSSNHPEKVAKTKEIGEQLGLSDHEVSRKVTQSLASIVKEVALKTRVNRLLLAGGETSASVCKELGMIGHRIHKELEPGLPSCIHISPPHYLMVLKSGSFGEVDFFEKAITHLKEE